ncbi:ABC transporter ATP-binding protein [Thermophagus xiamenensis]|uniref:ABC transporter ATP-binding protein n=1 Tax=Thermophagus xiamenensis TaxID=385682 RepID=UPI000255D649|nr:ATP-binding cassette domain-containing protein [Thermophagus xiamenensis]
MQEKIIDVKNLSVSFDERQILEDVSFSVNQGEIAVILGESGSGKSTILKHMLGLFPLAPGTVTIFGQDIAELDEDIAMKFYRKLGVFYQNGALLNSLTVAENIALPLEQHTDLPADIIEDLVRTKLSLVNLNHAFHLYPSQLSGGMLKRAAPARAIIMDPPLLFCDEPGAGLDPVSLATLDELILNLRDQLGMTVVMVTHEVTSILRIANKVIFVNKGRIAFEGSLEEAQISDVPELRAFFRVGTGGKK